MAKNVEGVRLEKSGRDPADGRDSRHTGHVVLITGSVTGIGFALAKRFIASSNRIIRLGVR